MSGRRFAYALVAAVLIFPAAGKAEVDAEAYAAAVARFQRGREAMRPCESVIDLMDNYFKCTQIAKFGINAGPKTSAPTQYIWGVTFEEYLQESRNKDVAALISGMTINEILVKRRLSASQYCSAFKAECSEFVKYWRMNKKRFSFSKEPWAPVE